LSVGMDCFLVSNSDDASKERFAIFGLMENKRRPKASRAMLFNLSSLTFSFAVILDVLVNKHPADLLHVVKENFPAFTAWVDNIKDNNIPLHELMFKPAPKLSCEPSSLQLREKSTRISGKKASEKIKEMSQKKKGKGTKRNTEEGSWECKRVANSKKQLDLEKQVQQNAKEIAFLKEEIKKLSKSLKIVENKYRPTDGNTSDSCQTKKAKTKKAKEIVAPTSTSDNMLQQNLAAIQHSIRSLETRMAVAPSFPSVPVHSSYSAPPFILGSAPPEHARHSSNSSLSNAPPRQSCWVQDSRGNWVNLGV
jgi:hypothetical protein